MKLKSKRNVVLLLVMFLSVMGSLIFMYNQKNVHSSSTQGEDLKSIVRVVFLTDKSVKVGTKEFPLENGNDGFALRAFLAQYGDLAQYGEICLKGLENADFSTLWRFLSPEKPVDFKESGKCYGAPERFLIEDEMFGICRIKIGARESDHDYFGRMDEALCQKRVKVFAAKGKSKRVTYGDLSPETVSNSYLEIWCDIKGTSGREIISIMREYLAHVKCGDAHDIYFAPY